MELKEEEDEEKGGIGGGGEGDKEEWEEGSLVRNGWRWRDPPWRGKEKKEGEGQQRGKRNKEEERGIIGDEEMEVEGAAMKGEGGIVEVGMEGEGDVENFMDGIGARGGRRRREEGWDWTRRRGSEEEGQEGEKRSLVKEKRRKEPSRSGRVYGWAWSRRMMRKRRE